MPDVSSSEKQVQDVPTVKALSKEQDDELVQYVAKWHHAWRQAPPERERVTAALTRLYKAIKWDAPAILWCESPWQMVMMRALLGLFAIAGGDDDLQQNLRRELDSDQWKRLWLKLDEQLVAIPLPRFEGKPLEVDGLFGIDSTSGVSMEVASKANLAQEQITPMLSLEVKLRMREVFRQPGPRGVMQRSPLIRGQFGLVQIQAMMPDELPKRFLFELKPELRQRVMELAKERLQAPQASVLSIFGGPPKGPEEHLFTALTMHMNAPSAMVHDFDYVAYAVKYLPLDLPDDVREPIVDWLTIKENVFHIECLKNICILCEAPIAASVNQRNQLHNEAGAAMEFRDGYKLFAWGGVIVPSQAVEGTENITVAQIDKEQNAEVRRILIQQYGLERYLEDSGARQIDADEFGVLYKKAIPNDEPVVVVKVTNRTPEADGSNKFYFLRVPPYMTSARSAVAWTFNMGPEEYAPLVQT